MVWRNGIRAVAALLFIAPEHSIAAGPVRELAAEPSSFLERVQARVSGRASAFETLTDNTTGVRLSIPFHVVEREPAIKEWGHNWQSRDRRLSVDTINYGRTRSLEEYYDALITRNPSRTYSKNDISKDSFVLEGTDGQVQDPRSYYFYIEARVRNGELRGLSIAASNHARRELSAVTQSIIKSFDPFPHQPIVISKPVPGAIIASPRPAASANPAKIPAPTDKAFPGARLALVIGNNDYRYLSTDFQLRKAVNDAHSVGKALRSLGFRVMLGENLDRQGMLEKLQAFVRQVRPGDMAVVFFAGHGVAIAGGNYLLPSDVRLSGPIVPAVLRNMAISESDIVESLGESKAKVMVLVLDACRNNPFGKGTRAIGVVGLEKPAYNVEGLFAVYSAGFGQAALDSLGDRDNHPNSVFTRVFVPYLARTDWDLADIVRGVRETVSNLARSVCHKQRPAYYDETLGGRIYLAGRSIPPGKLSDLGGADVGASVACKD